MMPTLFHRGEYRVILFMNDHPPPHVHVVDDGYAKVSIGSTPADVRLINVQRIPPRMIRSIVREVVRRRSFICEQWSAIHGEAI